MEPEILRAKVYEPLLLVGKERLAGLDIRVRVRGGGHTSQVYGKFDGLQFWIFGRLT